MRISDWSSDVCSSDLSGLLYLTVLQVLGSGCRCWGAHHLRGCRPRPRGVEKGGDTSTTGEAMFKSLQAEIDATMQRDPAARSRSEEHTSELQSLMRISYAVFCLKKKKTDK